MTASRFISTLALCAGVSALGGLALAQDDTSVPAPSAEAVAEAAAAAKAGRILVPGHRYTAEELAAEKAAVLSADDRRLDAWRAGDVKTLDGLITDDAKFIDGFATGDDQLADKARFLERIKAAPPPRTMQDSDRNVRTFGVEDDVAIVNGSVKDSANASDPGGIYTAIYLRNWDKSWSLARYVVSPILSDPFSPERTPAEPWSPDALSASQLRVMEVLRQHFDAMARRDNAALEKTIGDDFWYIRGGAPGGNQHGKAEYMAFKKTNTGAPEMVAIDKPDIQFYGNYGEVAVVTGVRRDATGGAVFGSDFKPKWRTVAYYVAVVLRPSTRSNLWLLEHYHAAFMRPAATTAAPAPAATQ